MIHLGDPGVIVALWIFDRYSSLCLKTVAFIAGKKNPAIQESFICFCIENFIENISLYTLSWPKLNFEIIFQALFQWKTEWFFWIAGFFLPEINGTVFSEEGGNGNSITQKEYGPHAPYPPSAHCGRNSGNNYS